MNRRLLLALFVTALSLFWWWYAFGEALATVPWAQWEPTAFLGPLILIILSHALRALRLAAEFRDRITLWQAWRLLAWHTFLVNLLPLRSGELALPLLLHRRHCVALMRAAATLIWLRLQDLTVLAGLLLLFWPGLLWPWRLGLLLFLAVGVLLLPLFIPLANHLPWSVGRRMAAALALAIDETRFVWHWTIANWCVKIAAVALLFSALLAEPPAFPALCFAALAGELGAIQPLQGVAGVGPYEGAVAGALALSAVPLANGIAVALAAHGLLFGVSALMALLAGIRSR